MVQAALGAELEIETLDGPERMRLGAGTESGTVIRLRGKGIPNLGRRGRGDLHLTIQVGTPRDLGKEQRKLLEELAEMRGEAAGGEPAVRAHLRRPT
jgi:molecular chaperone DnaJ